jgi:hypothetical protein
MRQCEINALATKFKLTPKTVESHSGGSQSVILERDSTNDRYYQVTVRVGKGVYCHVGLYREKCIVNDGETLESDVSSAIENASLRIEKIESSLSLT